MMINQLSDTLEVRSYLLRCAAKPEHVQAPLDLLEKFLERLNNGPFKLRGEEESKKRLEEFRPILAGITREKPEAIDIGFTSLDELRRGAPERQMLIYTVAESGSLASVLNQDARNRALRDELPKIRIEYQGERRPIDLERRLRTCFNANGLKKVLKESGYGISFAKIFEKGVVAYWTHYLAFAAKGHVDMVQAFTPMQQLFKTNMPIGRYPEQPNRWLLFVE